MTEDTGQMRDRIKALKAERDALRLEFARAGLVEDFGGLTDEIITALCARVQELETERDALRDAAEIAGDYLEACKVNGFPDLGDASDMPFLQDVIGRIDAALGETEK